MTMHAIVGRLGPGDDTPVALPNGVTLSSLDLLIGNRRLGFGISRAVDDLVREGLFPTELGVDLLVLATLVHAADTRVSRETESQDSWTRELFLSVPVSDPDLWSDASELLARTLRFLTGDQWGVTFRGRHDGLSAVPALPIARPAVPFDTLSLFSGGLDSLIGAIDLLADGRTPLLVSHSSDGPTSTAQDVCFAALRDKHERVRRLRVWLAVPKEAVGHGDAENSTRGRSFLFFAIAAFAATAFLTPGTIQVPENGLISLNVPLDTLRLGSHSTRTTHPFYMARWNELLTYLGIRATLANEYRHSTKGDMVRGCRDQALLAALLPRTMSCSSPTKSRYGGFAPQHCGFCVPCIIRRAAVAAAETVDQTTYTLSDLAARHLDPTRAEGLQVRAFQIAAARVAANPALAPILIHKPGPLRDDAARLPDLAAVYVRGMAEVEHYLRDVVVRSP